MVSRKEDKSEDSNFSRKPLTLEEFDNILENYKHIDKDDYIHSEIDRVINEILKRERYEPLRKLDLYVLAPIFITAAIAFISFLIIPQQDKFLRFIIPLNLFLSVASVFFLVWNYFRMPKRIDLLKEIIETTANQMFEISEQFDQITIPYLKLFYSHNCLLNKNFNTKDNEIQIKEKFLEIQNVIRNVSMKYTDLNFKLLTETVFKKPFKTDKYPRLQFFIDRVGDGYRYYIVTIAFFCLLLLIVYCYIANYLG